MVLIAVILASALPIVVGAFLHHIRHLEQAWTVERRELVNRVQAPNRLPPVLPTDFRVPDLEPDESGLVGTIQYNETGG